MIAQLVKEQRKILKSFDFIFNKKIEFNVYNKCIPSKNKKNSHKGKYIEKIMNPPPF